MQTILLSSIHEGDRARNVKKYGDLDGLIDSIDSVGMIEPMILSRRPDSTFDLIAGGRRYRAALKKNVISLEHGVTLKPGVYSYLFSDEVPEDVRLEAELDENLHRLEMDWIDNVLLIAKTHESKRKKIGHKWGVRQTAELLGKGYGKTNVNYAILISKELRKGDDELLKCTAMTGAIQILIKRKEDSALAELQRRNAKRLQEGGSLEPRSSSNSFLDSLNINLGGPTKTKGGEVLLTEDPNSKLLTSKSSPAVSSSTTPKVQSSGVVTAHPPVLIPLSKMFMCGDSLSIMSQLPDAIFDHVVTDIPYGIDMDNLENVEDVKLQHDVEQNLSMMPEFLKQSFRLTRSGGFCVFCYDLDHHEKLQAWAEAAGWKVQRWPYIICKSSPCKNQAPQYNTTKNYEAAMFLRRDEKTVLRKPITSSWKVYDFATERRIYNNPFAKPFELWKDFYDAIAFPGQRVYDPFCGEMSACKAAINCGLAPFGSEISEQHFNRGLDHIKGAYAVLHKNNVSFE